MTATIFLDFETNAIGKFRPPTQIPVQISYSILGEKTITTHFISGATEINPNFNPLNLSVDFLNKNGLSPNQTLSKFINTVSKTNPQSINIVAHNVDFDRGILENMIAQTGVILPWKNINWICTMKSTIQFCNLPSKNKRFTNPKFPKLSELAEKLGINVITDNLHSADYDVKILKQCWIIGKQKNLF